MRRCWDDGREKIEKPFVWARRAKSGECAEMRWAEIGKDEPLGTVCC